MCGAIVRYACAPTRPGGTEGGLLDLDYWIGRERAVLAPSQGGSYQVKPTAVQLYNVDIEQVLLVGVILFDLEFHKQFFDSGLLKWVKA